MATKGQNKQNFPPESQQSVNTSANSKIQYLTYNQFNQLGALEILAEIFGEQSLAASLLENIAYPRHQIPPFNTPIDFWKQVCRQISNGLLEDGHLETLMRSASQMYPGNTFFRDWRNWQSVEVSDSVLQESSASQVENNSSTGINIFITGYLGDVLELFDRVQDIAQNIDVPEPIGLNYANSNPDGSNTICLYLVNANSEQALHLREAITQDFKDQQALRVSALRGFPDHMIHRLFVEGPDQARFELINTPASTSVSEITQATMSQYHEEMWPHDSSGLARPAVADHIRADGTAERLIPDRTLNDCGIEEEATLQVSPESTAGGINPLVRDAALARVCSQILNYAKLHPNFEVSGNDLQAPTEYILNFVAHSWGPPHNLDGEPYPITKHEVFVRLPSNFPMGAPSVLWLSPIFHPNIHPKQKVVCLGELADRYRPGMDFEKLCQLLIDIASYQNYELREFYNQEAAIWAKTEKGQKAIEACGGRSITMIAEGILRQNSVVSRPLRIRNL